MFTLKIIQQSTLNKYTSIMREFLPAVKAFATKDCLVTIKKSNGETSLYNLNPDKIDFEALNALPTYKLDDGNFVFNAELVFDRYKFISSNKQSSFVDVEIKMSDVKSIFEYK